MPTRRELQTLAAQYLRDAEVLFDAGRYDAARYMSGYVLEMGLKARICRHLKLREYPESGLLEKLFKTHDFDILKVLAGLGKDFPQGWNPRLIANWNLVSGWRPDWRYQPPGMTRQQAEAIIKALNDGPDGIFRWLRRRW